MGATLSQVAAEAGVSLMTASRAVRGVGRVKAETRERVLDAVQRLGGMPNDGMVMSRLLHNNAADSRLRVILPQFTSLGQQSRSLMSCHFKQGVEKRIAERGGCLYVADVESCDEVLDTMDKQRLNAVILRTAVPREWVDRLAERGPVVYAVAHDFQSNVDTVHANEHRSAALIVDYLAGRGHHNVVWFGIVDIHRHKLMRAMASSTTCIDRQGDSIHTVRHSAWANFAHCQVGSHGHSLILAKRDWNYQTLEDTVEEGLQQILSLRPQPTAVVVAAPKTASVMVKALQKRGIEVPRDMSVIGYGVAADHAKQHPRPTLIDVPMERIGHVVPELIERRLANPDALAVSLSIDTSLSIGDTTGPAPSVSDAAKTLAASL